VWIVAIAVAIPSVVGLVRWLRYLSFCRFLVKHTNSSASLKDAAIAAKAYRAPDLAQLGQVVCRMLKLPRGGT
jgi:hypothetical protein